MKPKTKEKKTTIKTLFISGLLVLIPLAITVYVLVLLFNLLDGWLSPMGGQVLRAMGFHLAKETNHIPGFGILATVLLIFMTGLVASNYLGQQLLHFGERIIKNIPLVSSLYSSLRQVVDSFSPTGTKAFQTVVLFEFPGGGMWGIGFLTAPSLPAAGRAAKQDLVNVFYPASPLPTSGFLLLVPRKKVQPLPISAEEALKIVATMGVVQGKEMLLAAAHVKESKPGKSTRIKKS